MANIGACVSTTFVNSYLIHAILEKYVCTCNPFQTYLSFSKKYFLELLLSLDSYSAYFGTHRELYLICHLAKRILGVLAHNMHSLDYLKSSCLYRVL